jgi:hypothetical protein
MLRFFGEPMSKYSASAGIKNLQVMFQRMQTSSVRLLTSLEFRSPLRRYTETLRPTPKQEQGTHSSSNQQDLDPLVKNKQYKKLYVLRNKDEIRLYNRQYFQNASEEARQKGREYLRSYNRQYEAQNKEQIKEYKKRYNLENKEKIGEYKKRYKMLYPQRQKDYYMKNKTEILLQRNIKLGMWVRRPEEEIEVDSRRQEETRIR